MDRYRLTLEKYSSAVELADLCRRIYGVEDKSLIAAMTTLPYTVGRGFTPDEANQLHHQLRDLKVQHIFKSSNGFLPLLKFPESIASESTASLNPEAFIQKPTIKPKKYDAIIKNIIVSVIFCGAIYGAYIQWQRLNSIPTRSSGKTTEQFDAKIVEIKNRVEFRSANELSREKYFKKQLLKKKDQLKTLKDSEAQLVYQEGSRIILNENSLVVIGEAEKTRTVDLDNGLLSAYVKSPHRLIIKTKDGQVEVNQPESNQPAQISAQVRDGKTTVEVARGRVSFQPQDASKAPIEIKDNQKIVAQLNANPIVEIYKPNIAVTTPLSGTTISMNPQAPKPITFAWQSLGEQVIYRWTLAADAQMTLVLIDESTSRPMIETTYLDQGQLFWRVEATIDGVSYASEIFELRVQRKT